MNTNNPDLLKYVQDYELLLIEPHKIPDAEMEKFQTDFGQLMTFIKYANDKEKLEDAVQGNDKFERMRNDFVSLISLIAKTRFTNHDKEEETNMWKAFEDMQNEGMEKGLLEAIKNVMRNLNMSIQQAMDVLEIPEEDREKYLRKL